MISEIMKKLPGVQAAELGIAASKVFADALFGDDKNVTSGPGSSPGPLTAKIFEVIASI